MIRVTGTYYWQEGAQFDDAYYHGEHMRQAKELLEPLGLLRLESDRVLHAGAPTAGDAIAVTHAYFPDMGVAQSAMTQAGPTLMASLHNYTTLVPKIAFSVVTTHMETEQ